MVGRKDGEATWRCRCKCGNTKVLKGSALRGGYSKSCGCIAKERLGDRVRTHGKSKSRLYHIWKNIKARCYNPVSKSYVDYGARGIKMCDEWLNSPEAFMDWAIQNGYSDELTIERIDVNLGYSPENCKFIPSECQKANRRNTLLTVNGVIKTKAEWAKENNMKLSTLSSRLNKLHWSPERAVFTPVGGANGR